MIQVSHLTKRYGPRTAVSDLSFDVKPGEIVGFLGPNGAGKSTTMKILTGFMPATEGTATVAGHDVFSEPEAVKRNVGFLPENPPVYPEMVVEDYLDFAARLHQMPSAKVAAAVRTVIEKTSLGDVRKRLIGNLSKGYRQRVGLAQALTHNPKVLVLDEPTVGLDPKQIIEIRELIKGLGGDHSVILSSHILPEVTATCGRIIVINKGKIIAEDTIEQLQARLNKGTIYALVVKDPKKGGIDAIRAVPGVASAAVQTGGNANRVMIELKPQGGEVRDEVVRAAVESGMGVLEFAAERVSLEEIFLQLTTVEGASA